MNDADEKAQPRRALLADAYVEVMRLLLRRPDEPQPEQAADLKVSTATD